MCLKDIPGTVNGTREYGIVGREILRRFTSIGKGLQIVPFVCVSLPGIDGARLLS